MTGNEFIVIYWKSEMTNGDVFMAKWHNYVLFH